MINFQTVVFTLLILTHNTCLALECYLCRDQENNKGQCIKDTMKCNSNDDACFTYVEWRHWTARYHITKGCMNEKKCEDDSFKVEAGCTYDRLENWECLVCCSEDKCNYNVTLKANSERSSVVLILSSAATTMGLQYILK